MQQTLRRARSRLNCTEVNGSYPKGRTLYTKVSGRAGSDLDSPVRPRTGQVADRLTAVPVGDIEIADRLWSGRHERTQYQPPLCARHRTDAATRDRAAESRGCPADA